jgi:hypothetical protein
MQVLSAKRNEICINLVPAITLANFSRFLSQLITNRNLLIWWVQVGDLTTVEQVVNVLKERLFNNLCV